MVWLDIVLLAPILWGAYVGFKKGLIAQVLGLAGIAMGVWLGTQHPCKYPTLQGVVIAKVISLRWPKSPILKESTRIFFYGKRWSFSFF